MAAKARATDTADSTPASRRSRRVEATTGARTPSRTTARRELVENEIYEQASRLFAERGFAGTSLQDIADAMGITRPALYYYVKSKDDLLAKLVTELTEGAAARIRRISRRTDLTPAERLRALAHLLCVARATEPARFRLLDRSESDLPAEIAQAHLKGKRNLLDEFSRVVDQGVLAGQFRPVDVRVAALGIIGMCNWVAWWFHPGPEHPVDPVADQIAEMAVATLLKDGGSAPIGDGPAAALARLRQDLDYLERVLEG
jgi:AcrR family transcriptional regulator